MIRVVVVDNSAIQRVVFRVGDWHFGTFHRVVKVKVDLSARVVRAVGRYYHTQLCVL